MDQYYKLLNCNIHSNISDIKKQYTKLMKQTHPDKGYDDHLCKLINEAYQKIIEFKLNSGVDISENTIPIFFKEMNCDNIPQAMKYVEKRLMDKNTENTPKKEIKKDKENKKMHNNISILSSDDESDDEDFFKDIYNFFFN